MARECNAVNVGQGFPDFPPPDYIVKALADAATGPNFMLHQYTRFFVKLSRLKFYFATLFRKLFYRFKGHIRLVNAIANVYGRLLNHEINPMNEVLITVGAYNALFYAVFGLISEGDEVRAVFTMRGKI